ncbi:MAG: WD40 repeat domain-containing serine/threonine protein kinase, partial [Kofleriaceae bacterium]
VEGHDRELGRPVAIKRLLAASGAAAERFRREAHLTARLQHPGIVPIYAHGRDAKGAPYYAMRLVEGKTLAAAIDDAVPEQRISLVPIVQQVADTIAYAHAQHVIHRDLKPNNIMLGPFGETLVVDWGIAKDLASDGGADGARMTGHGTVMGTPSYMAPEQAVGDDVDERTDVYALGAILYHVLAGAPPSRDALAMRAPSAPPALIAIVEKAMAEHPEDRYPTARELADDLRRFATGQLVAAHRYSLAERAARLARRYRNLLLAVLAAIVAAGVVAAVMFARVVDARDAARTERDAAIVERARGELERDPSRVAMLVENIEHPDVAVLRASARASGIAEVRALGAVPTAVASIDGRTWIGSEDGVVTVDGARVAQLGGPIAGIAAMGARAVVWDATQIVVLDDMRAARPIACAGGRLLSAVVPRVGRALCVGASGSELVDLASGQRRGLPELLALVRFDEARIVARDGAGIVHAYDTVTLAEVATLPGRSPTAIVLAGDRVVLARGTEVVAWDPSSGALDPFVEVDAAAETLAVTDDGARIAVLQLDGTLRVFDARSRRQLRRVAVDSSAILLGFEPGGDRIALAIHSELHLVPVGASRRWRLLGHGAPIAAVAWSARGPLSISHDQTLRAWQLDEPLAVVVDNAIVQPRVAFSHNSARMLVWDLGTLREVMLPAGPIRIVEQNIQVAAAAYTNDGAIVIGELGGRVRRDRIELGRVEPGPLSITTSPEGDVIVHGAATKKRAAFVRAWDRAGAPRDAPLATPVPPRGAVTSGSTRSIIVARPGAPSIVLHARDLDGVRAVTWSASNLLAVVSRDHACVFAPDRSEHGYCVPHDRAGEAWFSPDARWLITSAPGEVLVWAVPAL